GCGSWIRSSERSCALTWSAPAPPRSSPRSLRLWSWRRTTVTWPGSTICIPAWPSWSPTPWRRSNLLVSGALVGLADDYVDRGWFSAAGADAAFGALLGRDAADRG